MTISPAASIMVLLSAVAISPPQVVEAFAPGVYRTRLNVVSRPHLCASKSTLNSGVDVANEVHPSVALVTPMGVRNMTTRGSGFVVDGNEFQLESPHRFTYLITAAHVAAPGFEIGLAFPGDTTNTPATVVMRNQTLDLALLRIDNDDKKNENEAGSTMPSLEIAKDLPPTGTTAFAHGYPASRLRGPAMTSGIVCGIADGLGWPSTPGSSSDDNNNEKGKSVGGMSQFDTEEGTTFVVTDAAMSGGMSGGPLTDGNGIVVGVNALVRPDLRALGNYAVSAEEVLCFLRDAAEVNTPASTPPSSFQVLLFNDPMNKKQRVANVLEGVANMNEQDANKVMMEAHTTGRGVIRSFTDRNEADQLRGALRKEDLLVEVQ